MLLSIICRPWPVASPDPEFFRRNVLIFDADFMLATSLYMVSNATTRFRPADSINRLRYLLMAKDDSLCLLHLAAQRGSSEAQYKLGLKYLQGDGVTQDSEVAIKWFLHAAQRNHALAQNDLGAILFFGLGVDQDRALAANWFTRSAEHGCANAQFNLGICYLGGMGFEQDISLAVKWFQLAARQGHAGAQNNLGILYAKGMGVKKCVETAALYFMAAVEQGHVGAQQNMDELLFSAGRTESVSVAFPTPYPSNANIAHAAALN